MNIQNPEINRRRKIVQDDKDYTSTKISDLARLIGFGLAGITIFFLTSSSPFAKQVMADFKIPILLVSAAGCIVVLCDYLQYYYGYRASVRASDNVERYISPDQLAPLYDSSEKKIRRIMFHTKHYLALAGALGFITILIISMFRYD